MTATLSTVPVIKKSEPTAEYSVDVINYCRLGGGGGGGKCNTHTCAEDIWCN